jgi:hypothetical protein
MTPARPTKLEAVRRAKEQRGDAPAAEIAAFVEAAFGLTIPPAIVTVLLASLREREALEASKRKALELIEQAKAAEAEAEQAAGKKPGKRKRGASGRLRPGPPDACKSVHLPTLGGAPRRGTLERAAQEVHHVRHRPSFPDRRFHPRRRRPRDRAPGRRPRRVP